MRKDKYTEAAIQWNMLLDKYEIVNQAIYNLGWIDLDKPRFAGYQKSLVLRADVNRRDDAHIFQYIIDNFGTSPTSRKKSFEYYDWTTKRKQVHNAGICEIGKRTYEKLSPQVKKWFCQNTSTIKRIDLDYPFYCTVPNFYFEQKISKYYITKVREHDGLLIQEQAEIKKAMQSNPLFTKLDKFWYGNTWTAPKWYRRSLNRKEKTNAKKELYNFLKYDSDFCYKENYRGASWYW